MRLSVLPKTWIIDIDGTILKHNGYIIDGEDSLLKDSLNFLINIPEEDMVILLTARHESFCEQTIHFLEQCGIRFDKIIFGVPTGERILINDEKPSGLKTAFAINLKRDSGIDIDIEIDPTL